MYRVVIPESEADANYAQFEFMLGWYDLQGNWQQKLFTDWENSNNYEKDVFDIGAITTDERDSITLTVESCTLNDIQVYKGIFKSEKVWRIFKDGTSELIAPDSASIKYTQRGLRYRFSFDIRKSVL